MRGHTLVVLAVVLWFVDPSTGVSSARAQGVAGTPHNLSVTGPGPMRARTETEICIFCHGVHNTSPQAPLWNRRDSGGTYQTYASSTLKVAPGQPSGGSRLCLSCHDGTIAAGEVLSRRNGIEMVGGGHLTIGQGALGTDLRDDHPFSFSYGEVLARSPETLRPAPMLGGRTALDVQGQVQCTSCHEPHDNRFGRFLRADPRFGALCTACHAPKDWAGSSHATSGRSLAGVTGDPWPGATVAQNACRSCHVPHGAQSPGRLLWSDVDEAICLTCHDGAAAEFDIGAEMRKWSRHDVAASAGVHDAAETPDGRRSHVECVDCHPPHAASARPAGGGLLSGALAGASGLDASGAPVETARAVSEICFKCHADSNDPAPTRILRVVDQPSIRRRFATANASFHPVVGPGRNLDVPSLRAPWGPLSTVECTDCHDNDAGPQAGGAGPRGPHGSRWAWLLERRYETTDQTAESAQAYALCYKCHDRASILGDASFKDHRKHIVGERTPCSVCHDAHGVDATLSGGGSGTHLVNFDRRVVLPNSAGRREFVDRGRLRGECSLSCHGEDHRSEQY